MAGHEPEFLDKLVSLYAEPESRCLAGPETDNLLILEPELGLGLVQVGSDKQCRFTLWLIKCTRTRLHTSRRRLLSVCMCCERSLFLDIYVKHFRKIVIFFFIVYYHYLFCVVQDFSKVTDIVFLPYNFGIFLMVVYNKIPHFIIATNINHRLNKIL